MRPSRCEAHVIKEAKVLVIILKGGSRKCDSNIDDLFLAFSDPYFKVEARDADEWEYDKSDKRSLSEIELHNEKTSMARCLSYASEGPYVKNNEKDVPVFEWANMPVIIIKDTSVCRHQGMKDFIKGALKSASNADLFFLCKWGDSCNKFTTVKGSQKINGGVCLKWSSKPTSTQAIMYTPKSRDLLRVCYETATLSVSDLLNAKISKKELSAVVFVPNLVNFDIDLSTSNKDYQKLSECSQESDTSNSTDQTVVIALIITFFLVFIMAGLHLINV